jgi:hypothetical protein
LPRTNTVLSQKFVNYRRNFFIRLVPGGHVPGDELVGDADDVTKVRRQLEPEDCELNRVVSAPIFRVKNRQ